MSPPSIRRTPPQCLSPEAVAARLPGSTLAAWRVEAGRLCRTVHTGGWKATLMAVNAIGHVAELAWHHPELLVAYAQIDIRLHTHEVHGLSERDWALAERIEALLMWRPGAEPGGALEGTPETPEHRYLRDN